MCSSSTLVTLAVVIVKSEIPCWHSEQGFHPWISLCHREKPRCIGRRGDLGVCTTPHRDCFVCLRQTRNDTGDVTQCYTIKLSPIYLNELSLNVRCFVDMPGWITIEYHATLSSN